MEYDPKTAQLEIERMRSEIEALKKDDRTFGQLNSELSSLQQKYEKFKEEKKLNEVILEDKLQTTKIRIQEAAYEKDKLEKDFCALNTALKNAKIATEEVNEMLLMRQEELSVLVHQVADSEETIRQREGERSRAAKDVDQVAAERKELKASFSRAEEELKANLKIDKELEDEEQNLEFNESRIRAEIAAIERETEELGQKEAGMAQKLKLNEVEQDRMAKFAHELAKEIMEIQDSNARTSSQKDDLIFKLKQESQRNIKLESTLRQYQMVHNATEESFHALSDKAGQLDARINQRVGERSYHQSMLEEDKKELERIVKASEAQVDYLTQIQDLHRNIAEKLESCTRNNKIGELKAELLKIAE